MQLDLRTIALILALVSVIQAAVLILYYFVAPQYHGIWLWAWFGVAGAGGFVLLGLRGRVPDSLSIIGGNGLLLLAMPLLLRGVYQFVAQPQPRTERLVWAITGGVFLLFLPLTFVWPSVVVRTVLISLCAALTYSLCGIAILRRATPPVRRSYHFTGAVCIIFGLWSFVRAGLTISDQATSILSATPLQEWAFLAVLIFLLCITAGLVAMTTQRLLHDLEQARAAERAALQAETRATQVHERRRLANELHDSVSQALFAARRTAEVLPQLWELDPDEGRAALTDLHRLTSSALAEMRALLIELRPRALVETPLHETLPYLIAMIAARQTLRVDVALDPAPLLADEVQLALYRICQEALNNVSKHSHAQQIRVQLRTTPAVADAAWSGSVILDICDDGQGFVPTASAAGRSGAALDARTRGRDWCAPAGQQPAGKRNADQCQLARCSNRACLRGEAVMSEPRLIRVLVVDDHPLAQAGAYHFLQAYHDMELVGAASNGAQALALCAELQPDIVLMDVQMPDEDGISVTRTLLDRQPAVRVIMLTSFGEGDIVQRALRAGAIGFLSKGATATELASAIRAAYAGRPALSAEATHMLIAAVREPHMPEQELTAREHAVLQLLAQGLANAQIAARLNITPATVKFHIGNIFLKLGVTTRAEVIALAYQQKLV